MVISFLGAPPPGAIEGGGRELLARPEVAERYLGVGKGVGTLGDERRMQLTAGLRKIFPPAGGQ